MAARVVVVDGQRPPGACGPPADEAHPALCGLDLVVLAGLETVHLAPPGLGGLLASSPLRFTVVRGATVGGFDGALRPGRAVAARHS